MMMTTTISSMSEKPARADGAAPRDAHPGRHGDHHHEARTSKARAPRPGRRFRRRVTRTCARRRDPSAQQRFQRLAKRADRRCPRGTLCYTAVPMRPPEDPPSDRRTAPSLALLLAAGLQQGRREERSPPPPAPPAGLGVRARRRCARAAAGRTPTPSARRFVPRARGRLLPRPAERAARPTATRASSRWTRCARPPSTASARCTSASASIGSSCSGTSTARGAPNSVEVNLSRFATADGAYAMFTKRVVADGDPGARHGEAAGGRRRRARRAAATPTCGAAQYLAELTFVTEDTKMTPEQMAAAERDGDRRHREARSARKLPGATDLPPAAAALPDGVAHPARHRVLPEGGARRHGRRARRPSATTRTATSAGAHIAVVRADAEARRRPSAPSSSSRAACPSRAWATRRCRSSIQEAPDRAKAEYVVARKGSLVAAVGDEELVLDPATPSDKQAPLKLTHDEKLAKLTAWLTASSALAGAQPRGTALRARVRVEAVVGQRRARARDEARGVDEARRDRVVVAARVGQVGIVRAVVADDARHEQVAHPLADERRHADEQVARVGVAHERDAPEARERRTRCARAPRRRRRAGGRRAGRRPPGSG